MLLTVSEFRETVFSNRPALIAELQLRGFDFDCIRVLWLNDLVWRGGRWKADPPHVHDTGLDRSAHAAESEREPGPAHETLRTALAQAYRILLTRSISACHLWIEDAETRDHIRECLG